MLCTAEGRDLIGKVTAWTQKTRTDSIEGLRRLGQIFKRELISSQKQRFQLKLFRDAFSREKKAKVIFDQGHREGRKLGGDGKKQKTINPSGCFPKIFGRRKRNKTK